MRSRSARLYWRALPFSAGVRLRARRRLPSRIAHGDAAAIADGRLPFHLKMSFARRSAGIGFHAQLVDSLRPLVSCRRLGLGIARCQAGAEHLSADYGGFWRVVALYPDVVPICRRVVLMAYCEDEA